MDNAIMHKRQKVYTISSSLIHILTPENVYIKYRLYYYELKFNEQVRVLVVPYSDSDDCQTLIRVEYEHNNCL